MGKQTGKKTDEPAGTSSGQNEKKTPRQLGYRMPAEWEPHEATWLAWPHNPEDWPGKFQSIPWLYVEIVRLIAERERVQLIVENAAMQKRVTNMLERAGVNLDRVSFHNWPTDRGWMRDSGPIFVRNAAGRVGLTHWRFNGWAKYDDWHLDEKIPGRGTKLLKMPAWQPEVKLAGGRAHRVVLEGGSIDVNGAGALLTTEECLLSDVQQRNPGVSREQLEQVFADYLGVDQVIWLGRGIAGDDTHGHVDDIARFARPDMVIAAVERDTRDPNHEPLAENLRTLKGARIADGKQLTVVELPLPRPIVFRKQRVPASYANFYIANGVVLVPTFHDANDRVALNTLAQAFPDRDVIGVHSVDLIWGLGALHCMTQQQPAASLAAGRAAKASKP
jgi:agmatine deiminase